MKHLHDPRWRIPRAPVKKLNDPLPAFPPNEVERDAPVWLVILFIAATFLVSIVYVIGLATL